MARDDRSHEALQPLLDRLAAGDESAVEALIERSVGRLRYLARSRLKGSPRVRRWHDTDDVVQAAAVRLVRALRAERPASPRAFLGLAGLQVRRELVDLARHERGPEGQGAHHASGPVPGEGGADPAAGPATEADRRDLLRHVQGSLSDEQREVFDLLHVQGLNQQEAAALLGVSVPTVKRRWREARERLARAARAAP